MNAALIAVLLMLGLSLLRINVVLSIVVAAFVGGLLGGLPLNELTTTFSEGLGGGATVALSYAVLGAFAVAIDQSGLPDVLSNRLITKLGVSSDNSKKVKQLLLPLLLVIAVFSQNIIPIHIAFIPILIPPLLHLMNRLQWDRRLIACILCFGLTAPYILFPVGFGGIFLNDILLPNLQNNGLTGVSAEMLPRAMIVPVGGMLLGLLTAIFFSYRQPRIYQQVEIHLTKNPPTQQSFSTRTLVSVSSAIVLAFATQLYSGSVMLGAITGYLILTLSGVVHWKESNGVFIDGMKMMAQIGFVMIAAAGFAAVMKATGDITSLVESSSQLLGNSQSLAVLTMLIVGLIITLGIGSSFSTIPIIAAIYVPLCLQLGLSPLATVALVGTAGALGDAGSPASDSTLGPSMGLNADGQHDHIWDTVVPTFIHYNIPLIVFGWIAVMWL